MRLRLLVPSAGMFLLLSACSVPLTQQSASTIDLHSYGLVVASGKRFAKTGAPRSSMTPNEERVASWKNTIAKDTPASFYIRGTGLYSKEVQTREGRITVLSLPPGTYSIADWSTVFGFFVLRCTSAKRLKVTIWAGTVTYLGAFDTELMWGSGGSSPSAATTVHDQRDRDLTEFAAKFPAFTSLPRDYAVIDDFSLGSCSL